METINTEKLNGHTKSESTSNNNFNSNEDENQLIEKEEVTGTPFTLIKKENNWMVALGKYRLSEWFATKLEAYEDSQREDWVRQMQVMGVMIEAYNETNKTEK